ncbi:MAG: response regulator [Lachnospira sp.]|nr:response regulator [Lachnospira sp.]
MKNVLIVEDSDITRKRLCELVKDVSDNVEVYDFGTLNGVYDFIINHTVDLFLIDIILDNDLPGDTSGLRFAEEVRRLAQYEFTPIIFITSLYDDKLYAYSKLHSDDYIEKPFTDEYVKQAVSRGLRFPKQSRDDKVLHFRMDGTFYTVKSKDVLFIENRGKKICVRKTDNKEFVVPYTPMKSIMAEAEGTSLVQCDRGTIINALYMEAVDNANNCISLSGVKETFNMGRTYKQKIKRMLDDL